MSLLQQLVNTPTQGSEDREWKRSSYLVTEWAMTSLGWTLWDLERITQPP